MAAREAAPRDARPVRAEGDGRKPRPAGKPWAPKSAGFKSHGPRSGGDGPTSRVARAGTDEGGSRPARSAGYKSHRADGDAGGARKAPYKPRGPVTGSRAEGEGFAPRKSYGPRGAKPEGAGGPREGGYKPRGEGGYKPRGEGGYKSRAEGGDRPRGEGGYKPRAEGGYKPRGEGGDRPRGEGGYKPRAEGGYKPRGYKPRVATSRAQKVGTSRARMAVRRVRLVQKLRAMGRRCASRGTSLALRASSPAGRTGLAVGTSRVRRASRVRADVLPGPRSRVAEGGNAIRAVPCAGRVAGSCFLLRPDREGQAAR